MVNCFLKDDLPVDYEKIGAHLVHTALQLGWQDDGEGAQEYVMRRCREVALEDAENRRGWGFQRYAVFGGNTYYACGGWNDMQGSYADVESANEATVELLKLDYFDWWQIVDVNSGQVLSQSENQAHS
jgi:hypothetical protein